MKSGSSVYKEVIVPAVLMSALTIGAGMFSLPYVFSAVGILIGSIYLAAFAAVLSVLHLMYAEVLNRTAGEHRFVGYARIHLGKAGFLLSLLTTLIGLILVLLIYLVLSVNFFKAIFPLADTNTVFLAFSVIYTLTIILGIKRIASLEVLISLLKVLIIVGVFLMGVSGFRAGNFPINLSAALIPYGAILFALSGRSAISSIRQYLRENNLSIKRFKLSLVLGTVIPAILYALFVVGVLGISGNEVAPDAITGIAQASPFAGFIIAILGMISLWTAYVFLGLEAENIFMKDIKLPTFWSGIIVAVAPVIMYFAGLQNFLTIIGISGGILLALESIMVILMWYKVAKPRPFFSLAAFAMVAIFAVGGIYELLSFLK